MRTLRGRGPAPAGYYTCHKGAKCAAWRDPSTGRFGSLHYHPCEAEPESKTPIFADGEEPDGDPPDGDAIRARGWERWQIQGGGR